MDVMICQELENGNDRKAARRRVQPRGSSTSQAVQQPSSSTSQAGGETRLRIQPSIARLSCHSESVSIVAKLTQSK